MNYEEVSSGSSEEDEKTTTTPNGTLSSMYQVGPIAEKEKNFEEEDKYEDQ